MNHHQNRARPSQSAREALSTPVDQLAQLETAGTFEPVPAPKKPKPSKPTPKKKAHR